jgi:CBS domain containing-hemolysin-like protein
MTTGKRQPKLPKEEKVWRTLLLRLRSRMRKKHHTLSEDDVIQLLEEGKRSGAIDTTEHELIESILRFTDTTVKEIMIPRTDVVAVDLEMPRETLLRIVIDEGYSRIPVYRDSIDNIVGILYTKDLLSMFEYRALIILQDLLRPPFLVPESKKISSLLKELQSKRQHMAVVIGEYGGMEGIVTMEDILEEIVGEIGDEYDEERKDVETSSDGTVIIAGSMTVPDFNEKFHSSIQDDPDYETISGFLHKLTGRIPELHEEIRCENQSFTVVKKNQRRIQQVKVKTLSLSADEKIKP